MFTCMSDRHRTSYCPLSSDGEHQHQQQHTGRLGLNNNNVKLSVFDRRRCGTRDTREKKKTGTERICLLMHPFSAFNDFPAIFHQLDCHPKTWVQLQRGSTFILLLCTVTKNITQVPSVLSPQRECSAEWATCRENNTIPADGKKIKLKLPHFHVSDTCVSILPHAPIATAARAAATGCISMSTRPDPERSGAVEIDGHPDGDGGKER